ncbi:MAG: hypothetical protein WCK21_07880 [Actinomycetota bacterium]
MHRIVIRLAMFALVLANAFGIAYEIGDATRNDTPAPVHQMDMP